MRRLVTPSYEANKINDLHFSHAVLCAYCITVVDGRRGHHEAIADVSDDGDSTINQVRASEVIMVRQLESCSTRLTCFQRRRIILG